MRILITTPIWPPEIGGPATYAKELVQKLRDKHQITVLAFADDPEIVEGVQLVFVSKKAPLLIRQIRYLKMALALGKKADLIYAQNAMAAGVPSVITAKLLNKPLILKFVGDSAWEEAFRNGKTKKLLEDFLRKPDAGFKNKIRMLVQKLALRHVNQIIVPSDYLGKIISLYYDISISKIKTIYNAAEPDTNGRADRVEFDPNQIITVARLVPWKGVDGIIRAVKILHQTIPDIKLVIAGNGPEMQRLKQLAELLSIQNSIRFLGNISKKETAQWRRRSSVFVLNSLYEGLPHSVLSSFAVGIPVVATDIPGTNEAVYDGKTGLLTPPGDPVALAQTIKKVLADDNLAKTLTANAKILLNEKFSWKAHLNSLNRLLESLVAHPKN